MRDNVLRCVRAARAAGHAATLETTSRQELWTDLRAPGPGVCREASLWRCLVSRGLQLGDVGSLRAQRFEHEVARYRDAGWDALDR